MAEAGTWPSISKHGLLSTTALLDLFQVDPPQRRKIESMRRPESVTIEHPKYGSAVIRDQKPLRESALRKCLNNLKPSQWYEILNRKTFFWLTPERLSTLLNARAYRNKDHCVITVDTRALIERHEDRITLCPINSGSTLYNPPVRDESTFYKVADYPFSERKKTRGKQGAVAELVVDYSVSDMCEVAISAEHRKRDTCLEVIWKKA